MWRGDEVKKEVREIREGNQTLMLLLIHRFLSSTN
jgi:hypothetical protein